MPTCSRGTATSSRCAGGFRTSWTATWTESRPPSNKDEAWLRVRRGSVEILANLSSQPAGLPVGDGAVIELASDPAATVSASALHLPPESVAILTA